MFFRLFVSFDVIAAARPLSNGIYDRSGKFAVVEPTNHRPSIVSTVWRRRARTVLAAAYLLSFLNLRQPAFVNGLSPTAL